MPRIVTGGREIMECPKDIQARLTRAGGLNLYGDPNFRFVWGWSRLGWVSGTTTELDESENFIREIHRTEMGPKDFHACSKVCEKDHYSHRFERWLLEAWRPADYYGSPDQWYRATLEFEGLRMTAGLGPYPLRGDYETQFAIEDRDHQFEALTPDVVDSVIVGIRIARARSIQQIRQSLKDRMEERKAMPACDEERLDETIDKVMQKFRIRTGYTGPAKKKELIQCA